MDGKQFLALALLKSLNGGSLPTAGTELSTTLTTTETGKGQGRNPQYRFESASTESDFCDGTITIYVKQR